ncbi:hypothetical protein FG379_002051 [Cryptosporidium bovis]|uniref:uncharacterized protein n=1 Tax=Cryptosporidium bovis TaxID=310047 RepID=UPI00351A3A76|nr:hypothetical protein FG379_002051 [Cryptosporidium bovis]
MKSKIGNQVDNSDSHSATSDSIYLNTGESAHVERENDISRVITGEESEVKSREDKYCIDNEPTEEDVFQVSVDRDENNTMNMTNVDRRNLHAPEYIFRPARDVETNLGRTETASNEQTNRKRRQTEIENVECSVRNNRSSINSSSSGDIVQNSLEPLVEKELFRRLTHTIHHRLVIGSPGQIKLVGLIASARILVTLFETNRLNIPDYEEVEHKIPPLDCHVSDWQPPDHDINDNIDTSINGFHDIDELPRITPLKRRMVYTVTPLNYDGNRVGGGYRGGGSDPLSRLISRWRNLTAADLEDFSYISRRGYDLKYNSYYVLYGKPSRLGGKWKEFFSARMKTSAFRRKRKVLVNSSHISMLVKLHTIHIQKNGEDLPIGMVIFEDHTDFLHSNSSRCFYGCSRSVNRNDSTGTSGTTMENSIVRDLNLYDENVANSVGDVVENFSFCHRFNSFLREKPGCPNFRCVNSVYDSLHLPSGATPQENTTENSSSRADHIKKYYAYLRPNPTFHFPRNDNQNTHNIVNSSNLNISHMVYGQNNLNFGNTGSVSSSSSSDNSSSSTSSYNDLNPKPGNHNLYFNACRYDHALYSNSNPNNLNSNHQYSNILGSDSSTPRIGNSNYSSTIFEAIFNPFCHYLDLQCPWQSIMHPLYINSIIEAQVLRGGSGNAFVPTEANKDTRLESSYANNSAELLLLLNFRNLTPKLKSELLHILSCARFINHDLLSLILKLSLNILRNSRNNENINSVFEGTDLSSPPARSNIDLDVLAGQDVTTHNTVLPKGPNSAPYGSSNRFQVHSQHENSCKSHKLHT